MATRQVTVLEHLPAPAGGVAYRFALWAAVPAGRQALLADPNAATAIKNLPAAELALLQNGSVAETVWDQRWPAGTTLAQVQAFMQSAWQVWQQQVTNDNRYDRYGSSWDGTTWTVVTNP